MWLILPLILRRWRCLQTQTVVGKSAIARQCLLRQCPGINFPHNPLFSLSLTISSGILEPAGITEIKFRAPDQLKVMHRIDPELKLLDQELEAVDSDDDRNSIKEQIKAREELLKPVYLQAATEFADLHDKTGRMKAKGVIKAAVPWEKSREFFYYRAKRRLAEEYYIQQIRSADPSMSKESGEAALKALFSGDWEDDKAVAMFYENEASTVADKVKNAKAAAVQNKIEALKQELSGL